MDASLRASARPRGADEGAGLIPSTVIVPLDGSPAAEAALPLARMLASTFGAALQRVTVEPGPDDSIGVVSADDEARFVLQGEGVGDALLAHLGRQDGPLLCLATRARGGLHRRLTGNLVDHVVAGSRCPVLVVGPGVEDETFAGPPATILVAASDHLPPGSAELAGRWAMAMDADVVVATVLPPTAAGPSGGRALGSLVQRVERPGVGHGFLGGVASSPAGPGDPLLGPLMEELAGLGIASQATVLTGGTVATSLLAYAEALPAPVLLVAPVGERDGRIPGDVTHQLLQRSRWPVVASVGTPADPAA